MFTSRIKEDQFTDALERAARALTDTTPLMQDMGEYLVDSTKQRFKEGKAPDGTPWAPKSQTTIDTYRRREKKGRNGRVDFRPLFGPSGALSSQIFSEAGTESVEWGSSLVYAATQQFGAAKGAFGTMSNGSSIPWGTIPARPFIGISDHDQLMLIDIIEEYLGGAVGTPD